MNQVRLVSGQNLNRSRSWDNLVSKPSRHVCRKVEGSGSGGVAGSENEEGAKVVSNGR